MVCRFYQAFKLLGRASSNHGARDAGLDEIDRVIDVGCGLGHMLKAVGKAFPKAKLTGVEYSDYLCERYGWEQGSAVDYQPPRSQDLTICNDVVCYLDQKQAARAIDNLASFTDKALFFGALTTEDWDLCDQERTDPNQHMRTGAWYRKRLHRHFEPIGGGLYLKKPLPAVVWTLDRMAP